ncbi:GxGYxYP domain-containing protein [Parapedobacter sp. 10938]|uniref:GxGYxYP domain-containing protein n=1 Tax=Parapedobacter flavus TaxID=3110225 RepID=UPI002DBA61D3|nr:GxGYxYP domain-containing protein [Parapedobacter sp. 10938]MEC3878503.1 GxGYxYP domain-containing protein [Parapedobacter sp. 10938]
MKVGKHSFKNTLFGITLGFMASSLLYGQTNAPHTLAVFDLGYTLEGAWEKPQEVKQAWDHAHTLATLQGLVNREAPRLYTYFVKNGTHDIDRYWWDTYRAEGKWLAGSDTVVYPDIISLIAAFKDDIKGVVVYDPSVPATSNVASAVAGADGLIAVRYDPDEGSLYHQLVETGLRLPVKVWLVKKNGKPFFTGSGKIPGTSRASSGSAKNDAYRWFIEHYLKKGKCNTAFGAYYIDQYWMTNPTRINRNHHTLSNHDYFVSRKAFFFDLSPWADEPATDDPAQRPGTDLETLKEFLLLAYQQNDNGNTFTHIGGFPPWAFKYTQHAGGKHEDVSTEWEYSRIISAYNAFKDADAIGYGALANASFWQHYPLKETYPQHRVTDDELVARGYLTADGQLVENGKEYLVFYVGDYDAASWLSQTTPTLWDDPNRGKVPLMWCISPVLARRAPMAMEYRRLSATANDYFAAADNGAGYLMPGMLQVPREISRLPDGTKQWAAHNIPYYRKWGLSITGFVIDGEAPGLDEAGLDAYAQFSPDGIVPQKVPMTLLHGEMPVLRSDADVNQADPAVAAQVVIDRVDKRPLRFHWFRNILKSPTWYVQVVDEIHQRNPNIELLDGATFFALYRKYLEGNPDAAKGRWPNH